MRHTLTTLFFAAVFAMGAQAQAQKVTVEIDFGGAKPNETHQVEWYEGMTAMTALQSCAAIESYPVKTYIFVTTINGVKSERGVMAWYYTVNGEGTHKLAFRYDVKPDDAVTWIYKKDVCSGTVDKQCEK